MWKGNNLAEKMSAVLNGRHPESFKALKPKAKRSLKEIKALSLRLKDKLGDHTSSNDRFYYKVGHSPLTDEVINNILERAEKADNKLYYFFGAMGAELKGVK